MVRAREEVRSGRGGKPLHSRLAMHVGYEKLAGGGGVDLKNREWNQGEATGSSKGDAAKQRFVCEKEAGEYQAVLWMSSKGKIATVSFISF